MPTLKVSGCRGGLLSDDLQRSLLVGVDSYMQQDPEGLNLPQLLGALRRRTPLVLLCVVLAAGAAFGFSEHETKKYRATAWLTFSNNALSQQIAGLPVSGTPNQLAQQANNLELVKLGEMSAKTAASLGHGLTTEAVAASLSIKGVGESNVVAVSATTTSPVLAAQIANTYARQFVAEQGKADRTYFESALALVRKQLAALSPQQRVGPDGLALQDRAQSLGLLAALQSSDVQFTQEAVTPTGAASPRTSRNTLLGGLLGLLLGLSLAFALERLDPRIRGLEELEEIYGLPLLGVVPTSTALTRRDGRGDLTMLPAVEAEAFQLIRAHLRFFNVDRNLRTILIVSAEAGDGKTTIARRLAEAAATRSSRVLLLECDLRHPTLARQLGIQPGPGLADMLLGTVQLTAATQSISFDPLAPGERSREGTLDVLVAGAVPPNPGVLIEGQAMEAVLEQARSVYDLVVIDAPPPTAVSDAFSLLRKVDGVIVVSRAGSSRRDAAQQLHEVLVTGKAPLLGIVANGMKPSVPVSYRSASDEGLRTDVSVKPAVALTNGASSANGAPSSPERLTPTPTVKS